MSALFALVGIGAVLFPFALSARSWAKAVRKIIGVTWALAGAAFLLFGAMNFFTHIGLIVNTMTEV